MKKRFFENCDFSDDTAFDVIVCAGQSNCVGRGKGNVGLRFKKDKDILAFCNNGISFAKEPRIVFLDYRGSFPLYFAQLYKQRCLDEGRKILLITAAVAGTGFSDRRWGLDDDLYKNAVKAVSEVIKRFHKAELKCFLWHQGEADAEYGASKDFYKEKLTLLINDFRNRFNCKDLPFIAGDYVPEWKDICVCSYQMSEATREITETLENCAYVSSENLVGNGKSDMIHFSRESLKELGQRYFNKYLELVANK